MGVHRASLACPESWWAAQDNPLREILDAIFYIVRSGCAWRLLLHEFPSWKSVHHYFRSWRIDGTWKKLHAALRERLRVRMARDPQPGLRGRPANDVRYAKFATQGHLLYKLGHRLLST